MSRTDRLNTGIARIGALLKHTRLWIAVMGVAVTLIASATMLAPRPAEALGGCFPGCCSLVFSTHDQTQAIISAEHDHLRIRVFGVSAGVLTFPQRPTPPDNVDRLQHHEKWLLDVFWDDYLRPALMMMTEQLTSVMMEQMLVVGTFFDAKQQLETQRLFEKLAARAHKDYQPSFGMCEIGTNTRSLAAAEFNGEFTMMVLNKHFLDRQLGNGSSVGAGGPNLDRISEDTTDKITKANRLGYFLNNTCDDNDLNKVPTGPHSDATGLFLCADEPPKEGWVNRDVDWQNTIMSPRTINVDFDREGSDNSRVFEMSNLLYGHHVFPRPEGALLHYEQNEDNFLASRAVTAKRSVAQFSYDSIVGLKARGTHPDDPGKRPISSQDTAEFMRFFLVELGFPKDEKIPYSRYMYHKNEEKKEPPLDGEHVQISYYAQMEVLAKKLYQRPEFYTDLYDKPANVERKSAAMQAIKLMLDRDIYESQLRAEGIMSMILELKVIDEQQNIENKLGLMKERMR